MKAAVLDASTAIKAVVQEAYSDKALMLMEHTEQLHAPAHWLAEAANGLWAKVAIHKTLAAGLLQPRVRYLSRMPVRVAALHDLIEPASAISLDLNITIYDALYLALATRLQAPVVSDDRRLLAAAASAPRFTRLVLWIGDYKGST